MQQQVGHGVSSGRGRRRRTHQVVRGHSQLVWNAQIAIEDRQRAVSLALALGGNVGEGLGQVPDEVGATAPRARRRGETGWRPQPEALRQQPRLAGQHVRARVGDM